MSNSLFLAAFCTNTLSSLLWAIPFGEEEVRVMRRQAAEVLQWYDNMRTVVPSWYRAGTKNSKEAET